MPNDVNVKYIRPELEDQNKLYDLIRDVLGGQQVMKDKKHDYLPKLNPTDKSADNTARNTDYIERAVFYNFTTRTVRALVGAIFLRDPVVENLPPELETLMTNADGNGLSLTQVAKRGCGHVLPYGRGGYLTDFPKQEGFVSKDDIVSGRVSPTITFYEPWNIINWRTSSDNSKHSYLTLVVLREEYEEADDGFESTLNNQYRVYRLVNGEVKVELYRPSKVEGTNRDATLELYSSVPLKDGNGVPWEEIPFDFVGSENNDEVIDYPPIYDLATINVAHYRNSADYEESVFTVGQPTPVISGLTDDWVKNHLNNKLGLGSRAVIPLPATGKAELLQAAPNILAGEAMKHKEEQATKLGAKLIEQRKIEKTATEAELDSGSENSVLSDVAKNVEAVILASLRRAAKFVNVPFEEITFKLNDNFDLTGLTAEEVRFLIEMVQAGLLTVEEARIMLRRSGMATLAIEDFKTQIVEDVKLKEDSRVPEPEPKVQPNANGPSSGGSSNSPKGND